MLRVDAAHRRRMFTLGTPDGYSSIVGADRTADRGFMPSPSGAGARAGLVDPVRRLARVFVPLALGAGVAYAVLGWLGGFRDAAALVATIDVGHLAAAVAAEACSFVLLGVMLRGLAGRPDDVKALAPIRLAFVVFGLGNCLPASPAEGVVLAHGALRRRRLARRHTFVVLGAGLAFCSAGLYLLAAVDALVVASLTGVRYADRWLFAVGGAGLLGTLAIGAWLSTRRVVAEGLAVLLGRLRRPLHPRPVDERRAQGTAWHDTLVHAVAARRTWTRLLACACLAWLCDALCLHWSLLGLGAAVGLPALLIAYSAGALASQIPGLPAGLGVVDAVTPTLLHLAGAPLREAVAAIVVYRIVATGLPALAGVVSLVSMRRSCTPLGPTMLVRTGGRAAKSAVGELGVGTARLRGWGR